VAATADQDWVFLTGMRDLVNSAIEPLRAAKSLATTAEAAVVLTVAPAAATRLEPYRDELPGFMLVASVEIIAGRDGQEPTASVGKTPSERCDRCWTYRPDVAPEGDRKGLCGRCTAALEASGA
jgi:isoleucyl-tRNA synthetase